MNSMKGVIIKFLAGGIRNIYEVKQKVEIAPFLKRFLDIQTLIKSFLVKEGRHAGGI